MAYTAFGRRTARSNEIDAFIFGQPILPFLLRYFENFSNERAGEYQRTRKDCTGLIVQLKNKFCDDAKVTATASDGPEKIRILILVCC